LRRRPGAGYDHGVRIHAWVTIVIAGCSPRSVPTPVDDLDTAGTPAAETAEARWYRMTWRGHAIGWAMDRTSTTDAGVRIVRREHFEIRRGDAPVTTTMTIAIDADRDLVPATIDVLEIDAGKTWSALARRDADGWIVDGERVAPPSTPSELIPALVARDGSFSGPIVLPGWRFATGHGAVIAAGSGRLAARTVVAERAIDATIELAGDGEPAMVADSTGVVATRVDRDVAVAVWEPVDMVAAGAIALPGPATAPLDLAIASTTALPAAPGQRVGKRRVVIDPDAPGALAPGPKGARRDDAIRHLAGVAERALTPDLGAGGDCTAYALAFGAAARDAGIPFRIVTGFVGEDTALVRHRWAIAWTGTRWIAVDPSLGEAPARRPLLSIAIHGDSIAELASAASLLDGIALQ
jgi:hypothetical protein